MAKLYEVPAVDEFFRNNASLAPWEVRLLQDEHNVNLNAAGEGDEFLDGESDELDGLTIMDDVEFFETYCDDDERLRLEDFAANTLY
jgi:hypothetical protein